MDNAATFLAKSAPTSVAALTALNTTDKSNIKTYVDPTANQIQIVVVDGGWVIVGRVTKMTEENELHVFQTSVIRRWGTTEGLGQIAFSGPTAETILDKCGIVRVPLKSVTMRIDVNETKWDAKL